MEQVEFAEQPRTHEQMRIGSLGSGMRVDLHDPVDDLWRGLVDDGREVLGRIRTWACSQPTTPRTRPLAASSSSKVTKSASPLSAPSDERGRETPQRHVLQGLLPAGEQGGRNAARRRRPVQIGQPARPAGIGVVTGQTGLVGECDIEVVDSGHDPPDVTRQTAPIRHLHPDRSGRRGGTDRPMLGRSRRDRRSPSGRGPKPTRRARRGAVMAIADSSSAPAVAVRGARTTHRRCSVSRTKATSNRS